MSGLSMPIPNATVATTTEARPTRKSVWASWRTGRDSPAWYARTCRDATSSARGRSTEPGGEPERTSRTTDEAIAAATSSTSRFVEQYTMVLLADGGRPPAPPGAIMDPATSAAMGSKAPATPERGRLLTEIRRLVRSKLFRATKALGRRRRDRAMSAWTRGTAVAVSARMGTDDSTGSSRRVGPTSRK